MAEDQNLTENVVGSPADPPNNVWVGKLSYSRSFTAKLILSDDFTKNAYAELYNKLLSFKKVSARIGWSGVNFNRGRSRIATIAFSGKTLCLFVALDPLSLQDGKYKANDVSEVKRFAATPSRFRIKSGRALAFALAVIDILARDRSIEPLGEPSSEISAGQFPTDTFENLLSRGLIKIVKTRSGASSDSAADEADEADGVEPNEETDEADGIEPNEETDEADGVEPNEETDEADGVEPNEETGEADGAEENPAEEEQEVPAEVDYSEQTDENSAEEEQEVPAEESVSDAAPVEEADVKSDAYRDTIASTDDLTSRHDAYDQLISAINSGEIKLSIDRKYVVDTIDEAWITIVEDSLQALDEVIRKPAHFIEETEELLTIERTKKVTVRSIQHLSQHTGLISRIEGDTVIPSKLLNIFRDDSMMTYENKFVNTLIDRLYEFVSMRFEAAEESGADREITELKFSGKFGGEDSNANFDLKIMYSERGKGTEGKNYAAQSDLWRRARRVYDIVSAYRKSDFATQMGSAFIRPPVMRTNPIRKNKNLRQCLALWEFIEGYENVDGKGLVADRKFIDPNDEQARHLLESVAEQYLVFRKNTSEELIRFSDKPVEEEEEPATDGVSDTGSRGIGRLSANYNYSGAAVDEEFKAEVARVVETAIRADEILDEESRENRLALKEAYEKAHSETPEPQEEPVPEEEIKSSVDHIPVVISPERHEFDDDRARREEAHIEEVVDESDEGAGEDLSESESDVVETIITDENGKTIKQVITYRKSVTAKLRLAGDRTKTYFCAVYNRLASKKDVRVRTSFEHISFNVGRKPIAKIDIIGRSVRVYLALDPAEVSEKYFIRDLSGTKRYDQTPVLVRVYGSRSLGYAVEMIDEYFGKMKERDGFVPATPADFPYTPIDELVEMKLARKMIKSTEIELPPANAKVPAEVNKRDISARPEAGVPEEKEEETQFIAGHEDVPLALSKTVDDRAEKDEFYKELAREEAEKEKKKAHKQKTLEIGDLVTPSEIKQSILNADKQTRDEIKREKDDEAAAASAELAERIAASGGDGDAITLRKEAVDSSGTIILNLPEKEEEVKPAPARTAKDDGDVLLPKPITLEELEKGARRNERKPSRSEREHTVSDSDENDKKGLISRLFGRRKK